MKQIIFFIGFFLLPFFCLVQNNFFGNSIQSGFEFQNKSIAVKIGDAAFVPADVVKTATKQLNFGGAGYEVMFFGNTMLRIVGYPATGKIRTCTR